jgi:hypothetical protein
MPQVNFLQTPYTQAYQQYYQQAVEQPLMRQRTRALQDLLTRQAQLGILRSGVSMYPQVELEKQLTDVLGREGARLALAQAQTQTQLEEVERQRAFQRELLERQIELQRQILDEQRRLAEQQAWGQLAGLVLGSLVSPALGIVGTGLAETIGGTLAPQTLARQRAMENLLMQYYQNMLSLQPTAIPMTIPMTTTIPTQPTTAGVNYEPQYVPQQTEADLTLVPYGANVLGTNLISSYSPLSRYLIPANQLLK